MGGYWRPLAVGLVSASTVAYEILLVRIFGIEHFHHFAYMAIGVAMLGFGASGTFLALARPGFERAEQWFAWAAVLTPVALLASATLVHRVPLDATQLAWDPRSWMRLAVIYLLLAVPFATGALAILLSLVLEPRRVGRLYGASFVGAGVGAALAIAILWVFFPARALAAPVAVASLAAMAAVRVGRGRAASLVAVLTVVLAVAAVARPPWRITVTPYKGLPQVEAFPDARRVAERTSPVGWVVAVEAPAFRHAPGLSLSYRGEFPRQTAVFVDGETAGAVSARTAATEPEILDWLPSAAPFALGGRRDVLVLGSGGGTDVRHAVSQGARRVQAVELHPELVRLARTGVDAAADVRWTVGDARRFVAATRERFDLITLGPGRGFGASAGGVHALNEDFMHTVEAYVGYLETLSDEGVLSVTRWLTLPPRESLRVILTAYEALRQIAPANPIDQLIIVRSWATVTVLVKPSGFRATEVHALMDWARQRRFDLDWYPGIEAPGQGFNILDDPVLYRAAAAAVGGGEAARRFVDGYPFDVGPVTDARPYPHHFLRAGSLGLFLSSDRGSALPFAEWGLVALLATFAQSCVLALLLLIVPVALRSSAASAPGLGRIVLYFSAIGLAFMTAEIAAIQQLTLLLGHPVYAVAAVLVALLVFSGIGSAWSDSRPPRSAWRIALALAGALTLYALVLLSLAQALQPAALAVRVTAATLLLAPLALLMGALFPLGLRDLAGNDGARAAWAWATNGFASVAATPLAALIALEAGSRVLLLVAALAYAGAAAALRAGAGR